MSGRWLAVRFAWWALRVAREAVTPSRMGGRGRGHSLCPFTSLPAALDCFSLNLSTCCLCFHAYGAADELARARCGAPWSANWLHSLSSRHVSVSSRQRPLLASVQSLSWR
ncbi:hypothetical protein DMC30DRAFT_390496 [Rhodotorula diobovata]|uniref:Secreted protein n=1 Tax=Rhodotorula diobovata TaxID=5288 RepID=A0A5C5G379_9BASI|nr:hypothetical protein DMC30DRAFT_390496 [Rhodotorula diobovata]